MPSPGYAYLTLGQARGQLAQRLQDTGLVYFGAGSPNELNAYIVEAIQTWQGFTASYKQRASLTPAASTPFYDLTSTLSPNCLQYTVTDRQIVNLILFHLLEPPLMAAWTGTGQFLFSAIMSAIQQRLNRFLGDTGCVITRLLQNAAAPQQDRNFLPDTVLDVRRAAWISQTGTPSVLWRDDQYAMQSFQFGGLTAPQDPPGVYGVYTLPPVGIQVFPPPLNPGELNLLTVQSGVAVGTTPSAVLSTPVVLNIPDDLAWSVVWGAMSDLLSQDGPARDPARANYCEQRYLEAVEITKINPTVVLSQVNGQPVWTGSVFELDAYQTSWQSQTGQPQNIGLAGRNLIALGPVPDSAGYGITLDVVSNIPVPANDGDFLQVDRGNLDAVLDYAQRLACFKMAGAEWEGTERLEQNFRKATQVENLRLRNLATFAPALLQPALMQSQEVLRV